MGTANYAKMAILLLTVFAAVLMIAQKGASMENFSDKIINLPEPRHDSSTSIEQSLLNRRSKRSYKDRPLTLMEVSQLLWAAQGITNQRGFRTAPSAGALYPLEIFVAAGEVNGLKPGIYKYLPESGALKPRVPGDKRENLCAAGLGQPAIKRAPAVFVITALFERTTQKYGKRGHRYVWMEAGHAAQNLCLQAVGLGLASVPIGAFYDSQVANVLSLGDETQPLYLLPVGKKP